MYIISSLVLHQLMHVPKNNISQYPVILTYIIVIYYHTLTQIQPCHPCEGFSPGRRHTGTAMYKEVRATLSSFVRQRAGPGFADKHDFFGGTPG